MYVCVCVCMCVCVSSSATRPPSDIMIAHRFGLVRMRCALAVLIHVLACVHDCTLNSTLLSFVPLLKCALRSRHQYKK